MNDVALSGLGLKQAVEILAGCVGEITLTVFVHPNFSPYQPPRPPTPYPLAGQTEDEVTERSVKFSLPPSPSRSNTSAGSIESLPRDPSIGSSPRTNSIDRSPVRGRSPISSFDERPRVLQPFPRGYGSPSMNLINTDWSLDRSLTTESSLKSLRSSNRDVIRGPVRVSHNAIPTNILPMPVSLESSFVESSYSTPSKSRPVPTPHPSLNMSATTAPPLPTYENLQRSSVVSSEYENIQARYPDYRASPAPSLQRPTPQTPRQAPSPRPRVVGRSPQISPAPSSSAQSSSNRGTPARVMGRRERAAVTGDRKVQFGGFKPINPARDEDEHYV